MRRSPVLVTALLLAVSLLVGPAGAQLPSQARAGSTSPERYAFLKAQVFTAPGLGAVAVGMPTDKVVKVQTRRADGTWTRPRVLFRKRDVTCGAIDGRASAGGVALMIECDTPYYEDQAPVHSQAFVTQDLVTWSSEQLGGEAYQDPAISADGSHAAWLYGGHGQYRLFSEGSGFTTGQTSFDYDSGGETVVVDDAGTVTVIGPDNPGTGCGIGVYDKPLAGPEDSYRLDGVNPGCTEGSVDNVDDRTVLGGGTSRAYQFLITREPGQRWALTSPAPVDAPGLVKYKGSYKEVIKTQFSEAEGAPLVAVGSPDRRHVHAQVYDEGTGAWGPAVEVYDHGFGGCTGSPSHPSDPLPRMHVVELHCYPTKRAGGDYPPFDHNWPAPRGKVRLLTSPDAQTWTLTNVGRRPWAISPNGALFAASGTDSITVVTADVTTVLAPVNATGRCDFVYPISPTSVLRLHTVNGRWPTRLQQSDAGGRWRTIQEIASPPSGTCQEADSLHETGRTFFFLRGDGVYRDLEVKRDGSGGWHVLRFSY